MSDPDDLTLSTLFDAMDGGVNQFAGNRAIIIDAAVVGFSRRLMLSVIGPSPMRELLLRLGFIQGWRAVSGLTDAHAERLTPERLGETVQSLLTAMGIAQATRARGSGPFDWTIALDRSCEVEEHLRHCGPSTQPVCWLACGFASGYLTRATARMAVCHEAECAAVGAASCRMWADVRHDEPCDVTIDPFSDAASAHLIRHFEQQDPLTEDASADDEDDTADGTLLGVRSPRMRLLLTLARRAAPCDSTVLIVGESGVGKGRLARFIHQASLRSRSPFVVVNCGAIPSDLLENELFGHRRGAFSGAHEDRQGLFEAAYRGTIFLDEVGDLPAAMQVKLLQVLQERVIRRLGETHEVPIDVRVIAATNRDLPAEVADHRFREDLFYRLNVLTFDVPPLRQRRDDLPALAELLLNKVAHRMHRNVVGFTPRAFDRLMSHDWPGNVRELENALEHACALTMRMHIDLEDLPLTIRSVGVRVETGGGRLRTLADVERDHILAVLRRCDGNRRRASDALGISEDTLYRRLRDYRERES